jgi:enoyl-CoA hydratase/carnithine racemase
MVETNFSAIEVTITAPWATLRLQTPNNNTLTTDVVTELHQALIALINDSTVRVILLTGTEAVFATSPAATTLCDAQAAQEYSFAGQRLTTLIEECGKPIIAVIAGEASGAGLELALACSLRLASDNAQLSEPRLASGLIPAWGGSRRLVASVGRGTALGMLLLGTSLSAQQASDVGLLQAVVPVAELWPTATSWAAKIATYPTLALRYGLTAINQGAALPAEDSLFLEATLWGLCNAANP